MPKSISEITRLTQHASATLDEDHLDQVLIDVMCIAQEGQIAPLIRATLCARIQSFVARAFSTAADVDWNVVGRGNGFTGGVASKLLMVSLCANRPLPVDEQRQLIHELNAICTATTNLSEDDVIVSIRNPKAKSNADLHV